MTRSSIIDFLPNMASALDRGGVWAEAGRAMEAGHRAPSPISLAPRLAIVTVLMLPLLWRLAEAGLLIQLWSWMPRPFRVWP